MSEHAPVSVFKYWPREEYRKTALYAVRRFAKAKRRLLLAICYALGIDKALSWLERAMKRRVLVQSKNGRCPDGTAGEK